MQARIVPLPHLAAAQQPGTQLTFLSVFKEFNIQDAIENNHSLKTKEKYANFADNLEKYLTQAQLHYIGPHELSVPILKDFVGWLSTHLKSCDKTHLSKHIYRINKAANHAVLMGYTPYNPTAAYTIKRAKNKQVVNLDDEEFRLWTSQVWHSAIYIKAQDNFIFQMSSGLSYMDIFNYKTILHQDRLWIESRRGKGGKSFYVPLWHPEFKPALDLHHKYKGQLPHIENHFYNRLIREMALIIGIDKYLTTHIGRKTFATLKDESGFELGTISAMLGNTEKICKENYINPSKKKITAELDRLFQRPKLNRNL